MKKEVGFIVLLLTQAAMASPEPEVVCSPEPVEAAVSEDVILQCHLEPPLDATDMTVEWSHEGHNYTMHLYQHRKDNPAEQREDFEGRTALFPEGLTKGNLSLKLSSVQLSDTGRYRCSFGTEKLQNITTCYVNFTVVPAVKGSSAEEIDDSSHVISGHLRNGIIAAIVIIIVILIIAIAIASVRNRETTSPVAECLEKFLGTCLEVCVDLCGQCVEES